LLVPPGSRTLTDMQRRTLALLSWIVIGPGCGQPPPNRVVHIAVAANFAQAQAELAQRFTARTGDSARVSSGATGQLYAQIKNGAPFDILLAADAERPGRLEAEGLAVRGSRFTYAIGRLVLYAPRLEASQSAGPGLLAGNITHVAIANPETAPYGAAALQVLRSLELEKTVAAKLVRGESISQTLQFVESGAADVGFVAYSQVLREAPHTYWLVPPTAHEQIVQDAVLLTHGEHNPAARAYLEFLRSAEAQTVIRSFGYDVPAAR
jgi:molybdate transport system substrate-binding protein